MMTESDFSDNKHADEEVPADIEQPSMLIRQDSIKHTSNKLKYTMIIILGVLLVVFVAWYARSETDVPLLKAPSNLPVQGPIVATPQVTISPTRLSATSAPSLAPTLAPTMSPTDVKSAIEGFLLKDEVTTVRGASSNPAVAKAIDWLIEEATAAKRLAFPFDQKYLQRFGILILYYTVFKEKDYEFGEIPMPNIGMRTQDECFWRGMKCDKNGMLIEIDLSNRELDGVLPLEWGFFPYLKTIDLSNNSLQGRVPEEFWDLTKLEQIYLYKNQLTGTISSKIGRMWDLTRFHVSHNRIGGSIPPSLASRGDQIRKLQYFNVHRNQMTGSIPPNMRLRQMYYMDLGRNRFSGTLPSELGSEYVRLRHLYLDFNNFEGTFPESYINAGNGRIQTLALNDNNFTGTFPGNHQLSNRIRKLVEFILESFNLPQVAHDLLFFPCGHAVSLTIENNNFSSMDRSTCLLDVFSGGELIEFKADCLTCRCSPSFMCKYCVL